MIELVRKMSPLAEFLAVVLVAFGYTILGNVSLVLTTATDSYTSADPAISNASLQFLMLFELVVLSFVGTLLHVRGWRLSRFGHALRLADVPAAIGLAVGTYILYYLLVMVLASPGPDGARSVADASSFVSNDISVTTLLAVSMLNPVFEEVLLCGYIVTVLKERRGFWTAVNFSLAIRLMCHLYQGSVGVISIVPLGFAFTYWYARTGRLWPLIIAHALFDLVGLWPFLAS